MCSRSGQPPLPLRCLNTIRSSDPKLQILKPTSFFLSSCCSMTCSYPSPFPRPPAHYSFGPRFLLFSAVSTDSSSVRLGTGCIFRTALGLVLGMTWLLPHYSTVRIVIQFQQTILQKIVIRKRLSEFYALLGSPVYACASTGRAGSSTRFHQANRTWMHINKNV